MSQMQFHVTIEAHKLPILPFGWKWTNLLQVASPEKNSIVDGPFGSNLKTIDYVPDGKIPVLTIKMMYDIKSVKNARKITQEKFFELKRSKIEGGDILVAKIGSTYGLTCVYPDGYPTAIIPANMCKITPNSEVILQSFLKYWLSSLSFKNYLDKIVSRTGQPKFNISDFKLLPIPLPRSMDEQKKIVQKLDYILGKVEEKKKMILQIIDKFDTKKIHQSYQNYLLNAAFSGKLTNEKLPSIENEEIQIPKGWELKKLEDVCVINPSKSEINHISDATEVTFVPMRCVNDKRGIIDKKETRKLAEVKKGYTYFKENDVIFAKITPCMQNGKSAIGIGLTNGIGFGSTEFHVLRPSKLVLSKWVHYFVRNQSFLDEATNYFTGSAGQQRVPTSFLQSHIIPIPPLETQKKIIQILDEKFQDWNKYKQQIEDIEQRHQNIRKSIDSISNVILNSAFSGKLVN